MLKPRSRRTRHMQSRSRAWRTALLAIDQDEWWMARVKGKDGEGAGAMARRSKGMRDARGGCQGRGCRGTWSEKEGKFGLVSRLSYNTKGVGLGLRTCWQTRACMHRLTRTSVRAYVHTLRNLPRSCEICVLVFMSLLPMCCQ